MWYNLYFVQWVVQDLKRFVNKGAHPKCLEVKIVMIQSRMIA